MTDAPRYGRYPMTTDTAPPLSPEEEADVRAHPDMAYSYGIARLLATLDRQRATPSPALRALSEAATPGHWTLTPDKYALAINERGVYVYVDDGPGSGGNAALIVAAVNDLRARLEPTP